MLKSYLEKNLSYLAFVDKELADRMARMPPGRDMNVTEARSGMPTLSVKLSDGRELRVHSDYDPRRDAGLFIGSKEIHGRDGYVLAGMGLGYEAVELAHRLDPKAWFAVLEAREDVFRAALKYMDLAPLLSRPRTFFFVGSDPLDFQHWLKRFLDQSEVDDLSVFTHLPSIQMQPTFYAHVNTELAVAVNRRKIELATLLKHAETLERNGINNLLHTVRAAGVADFRDRFKGCPAIVVAAGPSLNGAIELIKNIQGKAVIVCVGKVLKLLLKNGIVPEFTAHLDMLAVGKGYLTDLDLPGRVLLIYDQDANDEAVSSFPGEKVTCETIVHLSQWIKAFTGEKGYLEKGLSVAHTAFFLARELGADPIILVGVDLALPTDRTHAEGVVPTWGGQVNEKGLQMVMLPSVKGGQVRSLPSFLSFITAFESEFSKTKAKIINTSEGGAMIRGAYSMPLAQALEQYCQKPAPIRETIDACLDHAHRRPFEGDSFARASAELLKQAETIMVEAEQSLKYLRRIKSVDRTNKLDEVEFKKLAAKLNESRHEVMRQDKVLNLLQRVLSRYASEIRKVNKQIDLLNPEDVRGRTRLEAQRMELFFQGYLHSARFFVEHFRPVRDRILAENGARP